MERKLNYCEYEFEPLGLPDQDGIWQVWGGNI